MASGDNIAATPTSPLAGDGDHFAVTYASARIKFTEAALEVPGCTVYSFRVGGSLTQAKYVAPRQAIEPLGGNPRFNCRGVDNEDLYIDFAVVYGTVDGENPQEGPVEPENMVIHCCGVQGVDGYVGSGAQVALLHDLAADKDSQRSGLLPSDCLVFVHAVNPYGFSWWRLSDRCRRGVDISRNFIVKPGSTLEDSARFTTLRADHNADYQQEIKTTYTTCWGNITRSRKPDKQRVVELARWHGQYCDKHGPFYGGTQLRQETKIVLDFLWDLGLRPDNASLKSLAFVQATAGPGDKRVKESIVCPTLRMQIDVHNLGVGHLEEASADMADGLKAACIGCIGGSEAAQDLGPQQRDPEKGTSLFVAATGEYRQSLEGSLLQAILQQAPQPRGAEERVCAAGEGHTDQVRQDTTMPCDVAGLHLGAPTPLGGSDTQPRRVGAGRWTASRLPEGAGCKSVIAAVQHFTTSSEDEMLRAVHAEHRAAEKDTTLPLYAEERMNLRDAVFRDNIKLRSIVATRSWKLFKALVSRGHKAAAGPAAEGGGAAAPKQEERPAADADGVIATTGDEDSGSSAVEHEE